MSTKFWVVWNPQASTPRVRHASEIEARNEAVRLARMIPGSEFFVLESKTVSQTPPPVLPSVITSALR